MLATAVGGLAGVGVVAAVSALSNRFALGNPIAVLHLIGALEGAALGFTQWLVLRHYIRHVGWWILATTIGAIVAWLVGIKVSVLLLLVFFDGSIANPLPAALLGAVFWLGVWVGAVLGLAQWLVLRTHVRRGALWVLANAIAWGLGLPIAFFSANLVQVGEFGTETVMVGVATGATVGTVIGAVTGAALLWLLKPRLTRHS